MPMPDTEDFAPDITCLSGFTPGPSPHDAHSTTTQHAISALTSSLMTSRTDNGQQHTQPTQATPTTTPTTQPTRPARPMPPRRKPGDNSHHQDQKMAEPMPPDTTALQQAGRACQNTSATNNSCLLHSVIAEVQRIQKTKHLTFPQQSETLRTEIASHMHQHQNLWLDNAPPSTTNLKAIPSTPLQQLQDRITSCATSGTYLGTDQLHIMATMLHPQGIRIVNYRFDRLCFDQLTLIHHLDYTNPHPNNALQTSLLNPQDIRPNDIVLCNAQPGRHWEACPPLTGSHPILGDSFAGNDRVLFLPRHPPPNITGDNDRRQDTQTKSAKRKLVFHTQSPTLTDNPTSQPALEYLWAAQPSPAAEGCSSGTRPTRPRLLPTPLPTPPPPLSSPPPSLDDSSRAGQKRPADDTASHTPTGWPTKDAKHRGISSGHQRPAQDTTTLTDDRRQQYTAQHTIWAPDLNNRALRHRRHHSRPPPLTPWTILRKPRHPTTHEAPHATTAATHPAPTKRHKSTETPLPHRRQQRPGRQPPTRHADPATMTPSTARPIQHPTTTLPPPPRPSPTTPPPPNIFT